MMMEGKLIVDVLREMWQLSGLTYSPAPIICKGYGEVTGAHICLENVSSYEDGMSAEDIAKDRSGEAEGEAEEEPEEEAEYDKLEEVKLV